jgi:hypothetical protein
MKIPVTGFVMDSGDGDTLHSHKLYITSWNGRPVHVHAFSGVTSIDDGHSHQYASWTAPAPLPVCLMYTDITPLLHWTTDILTSFKEQLAQPLHFPEADTITYLRDIRQ